MELRGDLPGRRRELRMQIGPFSVAVTEIPGRSLTGHEWHDIELARRSYTAMWGETGSGILDNDPLDGRNSAIYDTRHYLAWVRDGDGPCKLVTMRKVTLDPSRLTRRQRADPLEVLPVDVRFWRVHRADGGCVPLWHFLRARARRMAPNDELAEFRVATIARTGTFPFGERQRTARERERTGIAFAAIQLLAAHGDPSLLYVASLCPEFRDRVLGVVNADGEYVPPAFTTTEQVLGLPPGSVRMDNGLPLVRDHKAAFPGYFIHNDDAARLIAALLDQGRVTMADLAAPITQLVERESATGRNWRQLEELLALVAARDHRALAAVLTRPHLFKYLTPLIAPGGPLAHLVSEVRDGPFSATLIPSRWVTSAWSILEAAEAKYAEARPDLEPVPAPGPRADIPDDSNRFLRNTA
jgi:hypothetical protein